MKILETSRLTLREVIESDAEFMLELLNQPSWIKYIGDRGVRTVEQAKDFISNKYRKSYEDNGFGLYTVELKPEFNTLTDVQVSAPTPIGICGLVKRDSLPDPDIGFALLIKHEGKGYASEAAEATLEWARETLGLKKILAITTQDNESSIKLLTKIGFKFDSMTKQPHDPDELKLFLVDFS